MTSMRYLAVIVSAALAFVLVAPAAFAQPFADVPTNHWAYDAIAELAAKGIVEGYPDGTFKGDRAMTRYEMAMVVARLLARIESIQVPSAPAAPAPAPAPVPAAPPITRVDVETIQRLVNEFRAELAALGVRTTAIEEELNALKARIGNVKFGGNLRFRSEDYRSGTTKGAGVNGNGNLLTVDSGSSPTYPRTREIFKLNFDGSVNPDLHLIGALLTNVYGYQIFNSSAAESLSAVDSLFFDFKNAFGMPLEFWFGRWGCSGVGACYATQFGPFGLLMNSTGDTWEDTTADSGNNIADGIMAKYSVPSLFDLKLQAAIIRLNATGSGSFGSGDDNVYGLDANVGLLSGLRLGAYYVSNNLYGASLNTITYGPGGGSIIGAGSGCTSVAGGMTCDAAGNGWGAYVQYDFSPGIHVDGEWATWNDTGPAASSDNGYQLNIHWDLGALTGMGHNFSLDTGYLNYGQNFHPPTGAAEADIAMNDNMYPGNANGFLMDASYDISQSWTLYGVFFTGNQSGGPIGSGSALSEYEAGIVYKFAPGAKVTLKIRDEKVANIDQLLIYRAQVDYSF